MICWSCQKAVGDDVLCPGCNAVQPPDPKADFFRVLGIPRAFAVDIAEVERRYKETTRILHPDRFARADPQARRASLERSVQLNEAWQVIKDPVRRAEYLLSLHGVDIGDRAGGGRSDQSGAHVTLPVPQALLLEVMELREALAQAQADQDLREVEALIAKVAGRLGTVMDEVARSFSESPPDLGTAAARLVTVRYYRRFLFEARQIADVLATTGGTRGRAG